MSDVPKKKRKCIQLQTRQTIAKVYDFMKNDAQKIIDLLSDPQYFMNPELLEMIKSDLNRTQKRTAEAVGISLRTLQNILNEERNSNFKSPHKYRKESKKQLEVNQVNADFVESYIECYTTQYKRPPTFENIMTVFREERSYVGSVTTLRAFLAKLGYNWKRTEKKTFVIVKDNDKVKTKCNISVKKNTSDKQRF
ncbi:hypothetical protein K1T71_012285 [Dendrolimus kikuchii]|uniref:Uncharacterized protein n=1 Tax=Dendrolimus kikuchii TaxID=765133 RepID=A0ACC1CLD9_9NEOP|nr:hypothetical protein K1T71_012285 [Dendrolimus kikuchii]